MKTPADNFAFSSSEILLFIGAGATAKLNMPTTDQQGDILRSLCHKDEIAASDLSKFPCFLGMESDVCDLLNILNYTPNTEFSLTGTQSRAAKQCFPDASEQERFNRVMTLRRQYDWPTLKTVAQIKYNAEREFTQSVFTLIDACLREERGFIFDQRFVPSGKLRAARELYILLINTMFACAWQQLCRDPQGHDRLDPYIRFTETLADMMYREGKDFCRHFAYNQRGFYLFSYAMLTTNFDPIFLWLTWQAHRKLNREKRYGIGSPNRLLQLFLDFPNTLAMREPAEKKGEVNEKIWYPISEAAVQKLNAPGHLSDRTIRLGKYYAVHGCSCFRHCPVCGRLNLHSGDSWDLYSGSVFPPGPTQKLAWNIQARNAQEAEAHRRGEYDALKCHFCGNLTYADDNCMFMQSKLKTSSPSFIKEITDEAIAAITKAKHIVLLGYSLPPDDAIWGAVLSAMTAGNPDHAPYCSVVCGYTGPQKWLWGKELDEYINTVGKRKDKDVSGLIPIQNAIDVFGRDRVRAYTGGIPQVFENGTETAVRELLYAPEWIPQKIFERQS